ncbi:exonuclease SbcC [Actinacidiphila yanglinensis]|uniref:Nuclease SbcCD subunit C n=1 Tax=Actinacidiphila yanglinensis TaxID=310779 RepID=A0A1H6CE14_9ACTN|nr:AAA family ATPase [Actinacidiphila yanglinensis]SEG70885.1 exonuclease SbcC [Actinacidiphila yanglinensis]
MRLHRLVLTAFGPFAGSQRVDFDELSAAGLFLLHGPTGAGKTSVLDAVCYALYGQVPGARPANRLRSDHAEPATPTEVVLELTVGGRRLEITRRPEQLRAKKRGTGTTVDKPVTLLREHVGGTWQGLSTSHQEIGEEVRQLLGMSCEQFCQVVLLPQGEFATFLRAGAVERAALLGRLFDTRRFKAVEQWLRDRRHDAERQLAAGDGELRQLGARMRQAAGYGGAPYGSGSVSDPSGAPDDGPGSGIDVGSAGDAATELGAGLLAEAAVLRCEARERYDVTAGAVRLAEDGHRTAAEAAAVAREVAALQQRRRDALDRETAAARQRPARAAVRDRLDRAHRALAVDPALGLHDKAAARHAEALAAERAAVGRLAGSGELPALLAADLPADAVTPIALPAQDTHPTSAAPTATGRGSSRSSGAAHDGFRAGAGRGEASARRGPSGPAPGEELPGAAGGEAVRGVPAQYGPRRADAAEASAPAPRRLSVDAIAGRVGELREELGSLAGAGEAEARLEEIARRRELLEREERADEGAVREAQAWLEGWARERGRLQGRVEAAAEAAARAEGLAGRVEAARGRRDAAAERDRLARGTERAEQAAREARDRAAEAREAWQDAREARIAGIAAELADGLVDGEPCRVCGAEQHPAPARPGAGRRTTSADEDRANAAYEQRRSAYETAGAEAARLRAARDAAAASAGAAPYAELAAACAESEAEHAAAVRSAGDLTEARRALARAEEERERRTAQREGALSRSAARTSRREELDEQHQRLAAELARIRAGHATVRARHASLTARVGLLDLAADAARERIDGERRLAEAVAALAQAAAAAGFGSAAEAAAALLPPAELARTEREVAAWAREEAAIEAALAAPEPAAAAALPPADPDGAQQSAQAAHRRLRDASSAESAAATRCRELDRLTAEGTSRVRELAPAREEFSRLKRLADLVAGNSAENQYRMELETYVLAARLEQVAAAAGVRLQRMSAGRYTLVHSDARAGHRAKSGLGLMVVDAWTGTERDTATLSGGETFFASLALALGLADVVTDEAGGVRLDTLFIDEGFGSLDEQTLDEVLDVLDGLRARDRAVGIVSHVADLRHRIPAQLRVVKDKDGSSVRMHTGAR